MKTFLVLASLAVVMVWGHFYAPTDTQFNRDFSKNGVAAEHEVVNQLGSNEWSIQKVGDLKFLTRGHSLMSKGYERYFVHNGKVWGARGSFAEPVATQLRSEPEVASPYRM